MCHYLTTDTFVYLLGYLLFLVSFIILFLFFTFYF